MPYSSRKQVNGLKGKQAQPNVMTGLEETMTATLGEEQLGTFLSLLSELEEAVSKFFVQMSVYTLICF